MWPRATYRPMSRATRVLFVCLGNICRSPMAEGVFRHAAEERGRLDQFETDSAGLGDWHVGQAPDERAQGAARARGVEISGQRARQMRPSDFDDFDLVLAMDEANLTALKRLAPKGREGKVRLFLDYAPDAGTREVSDPFFGDLGGFDTALDLIELASDGLLRALDDETIQPASQNASSTT